jgi:uncharacterized sporulation protein YeaH/YhbH (DUF444 family)
VGCAFTRTIRYDQELQMQSSEEKLKAYATEMGVQLLTLDVLIDSHRSLRASAQRSAAERRAEMQAAREHATKQATDEVKELGWFSVERLRSMSVGELAELLRTD